MTTEQEVEKLPKPVFLGDWFINVDPGVIEKHGLQAVTDMIRRNAEYTIEECKKTIANSPLGVVGLAITFTAIAKDETERAMIKEVHRQIVENQGTGG